MRLGRLLAWSVIAALAASGSAAPMSAGDVKTETPAMTGRQLSDREEALRREEERLKALRQDVDERIAKYTKLLEKIEQALTTFEDAKKERTDHLVKVYEAMPNEEASARLSALDEETAVLLLSRMKSKKAGAVMAFMDPRKAASLTEGILAKEKKLPGR